MIDKGPGGASAPRGRRLPRLPRAPPSRGHAVVVVRPWLGPWAQRASCTPPGPWPGPWPGPPSLSGQVVEAGIRTRTLGAESVSARHYSGAAIRQGRPGCRPGCPSRPRPRPPLLPFPCLLGCFAATAFFILIISLTFFALLQGSDIATVESPRRDLNWEPARPSASRAQPGAAARRHRAQ